MLIMNKDKIDHIKKYLDQGKRLDGRAFDQFRDIEIEYDISKSAEGSASVKIGDTQVMAGVKLSLGTPYPDTPEEGSLMVEAEFTPLASPNFESGKPGIESIELARVVDRGIREAKAVDMKKLCIEKGVKNWNITVDVIIINDAGNLIDAASLAALAALKNAKFPKYEDGELDYKTKTNVSVPLDKEPLAVTIFKIGGKLVIDPLLEEQDAMQARLTITSVPGEILCALQKGGNEPLTPEEINEMIEMGIVKGEELRQKLEAV